MEESHLAMSIGQRLNITMKRKRSYGSNRYFTTQLIFAWILKLIFQASQEKQQKLMQRQENLKKQLMAETMQLDGEMRGKNQPLIFVMNSDFNCFFLF